MTITWQAGKYIEFVADVPLKIGSSDPAVSIPIGSVFLFDGTTLTFSGVNYPGRGLRNALNLGWYHPAEGEAVISPQSYRQDRAVAIAKAGALDLSHGAPIVVRQPRLAVYADEVDTVMRVEDRKEKTEKNQSVQLGAKVDARSPQVVTSSTLDRARKFPVKVEGDHRGHDLAPAPTSSQDDMLSTILGAVQNLNKRIDTISNRVDTITSGTNSHYEEAPRPEFTKRTVKPKVEEPELDEEFQFSDGDEGEEAQCEMDPKVAKAISIMPSFPKDFSFSGKVKDRVDRVSAVYKSLPKSKKAEFISTVYLLEDMTARKALSKLFPA